MMKCKHYGKKSKSESVYTYTIQGEDINLCRQCEMDLLAEMKKQEVLENKLQVFSNIMFERDIDKLKSKLMPIK